MELRQAPGAKRTRTGAFWSPKDLNEGGVRTTGGAEERTRIGGSAAHANSSPVSGRAIRRQPISQAACTSCSACAGGNEGKSIGGWMTPHECRPAGRANPTDLNEGGVRTGRSAYRRRSRGTHGAWAEPRNARRLAGAQLTPIQARSPCNHPRQQCSA